MKKLLILFFLIPLTLSAMDEKKSKKSTIEEASAPATEYFLYGAGIGDGISIEFIAQNDEEGKERAQQLLGLILLACTHPKQSLEELIKSKIQVTVTTSTAQAPAPHLYTDMDDDFLDELNKLEGVSPMFPNTPSPITSPVTLTRQMSFPVNLSLAAGLNNNNNIGTPVQYMATISRLNSPNTSPIMGTRQVSFPTKLPENNAPSSKQE